MSNITVTFCDKNINAKRPKKVYKNNDENFKLMEIDRKLIGKKKMKRKKREKIM